MLRNATTSSRKCHICTGLVFIVFISNNNELGVEGSENSGVILVLFNGHKLTVQTF